MTQDEIIKLASEAGISEWAIGTGENRSSTQGRRLLRLERFAALVAEATRNDIADFMEHGHSDDEKHNIQYAQSIRSMK